MRKVVVSSQKSFVVLTALHVLSACIVLTNEFLAINNMVPGGNFPIEHQFSWARVLLFCGLAIASVLVLWVFTVKKDSGVPLPSFEFVLSVAAFVTAMSVLYNYPSVTGWCCDVYPTRYFGFPFSFLYGNRLIGSHLILEVETLTSYRLRFPSRFFLDLVFWSSTAFIVLSSIPFLIQKRKAGQENKKAAPAKRSLLPDRVVRLFLALFFGVIAGMVAFLFPARPAETPAPTPVPFIYIPTSTSTHFPPSTPSDRLLALVSASTPMPEQTLASTATPTIPLQRSGHPEDVAYAVAFLASQEANYSTGQVLNVDGGMVMD